MKSRLPDGVLAASLTPLHEDLAVDHDALAAHCRWLLGRGCDGIAVLGTTGEANSFSVEERLELMDRLAGASLPLDRIIVGTGCCALPDTVTLTRRAVELRFAGALVLPPFYYKRIEDDGLFDYFNRLVEEVGDRRLSICLYHFPALSGLPFSHELIGRLVDRHGPVIAGIKDSSGDLEHTRSLCAAFPDLPVFTGTERFLLEVLECGGAGCISASANLISPLAAKVYRDRQAAQQEGLAALRLALETHPFVPALKWLMAEWTGKSEWRNLRAPHMPLDEEAARNMVRSLEDLKEYAPLKPPL